MTETVIHHELPFAPRPWQLPLLEDQARNIVAVVHRRAGKSTCLMWRGLKKAATEQRLHLPRHKRQLAQDPPRVVHVLPLAVQWGKTGLWDRLERAANAIPGAKVRRSDMRIIFPNGGVYQAGGMDNPDKWRGGYVDEIIEDEADDVVGKDMAMVVEPMLADYGGSWVKSGTPKGNDRLKGAYDHAGHAPGHSRYLLPYWETKALSDEAIARLRTKLDEDEFRQEMECSFEAPNSGSYYGKKLEEAERDGRIGIVPHEPRLPVHTAWDLGVDDCTAIWFVQIMLGGDWRIIDYLENNGVGSEWYVEQLKAKPYSYGTHHMPHDVAVTEWGTGKSRKATLESLGLKPIKVGRQMPVADGINAVRMLLPKCRFDAARCELGLKALRGYRRELNEDRGVWSTNPVHDWASHGADAFRELAVSCAEPVELGRMRMASAQADSDYSPFQW